MSRYVGPAVAALLAALSLVGCAAGRSGRPPEPPPRSVVLPFGVQELVLTVDDFRLDPSDITVIAGSRLILTIRNVSGRLHNVTIAAPDGGAAANLDIAPRASQRVDVTPQTPGIYMLFCDQLGHQALGEQGVLRVVPAP
jgi:plastocyanin